MGLPSLNHPQGSVSPTPSHPGADPSSTKGLHLPDVASSCHPAGGSGPWAASLPSLHRHPCGWGLWGQPGVVTVLVEPFGSGWQTCSFF